MRAAITLMTRLEAGSWAAAVPAGPERGGRIASCGAASMPLVPPMISAVLSVKRVM
jgi:hypothetical protein